MPKPKPEWLSLLPGGKPATSYTFDELRSAKQAHAFLTEPIPGPAGLGVLVRGFRYLLFFGIACVAENKYPPLTRCWRELERLFMNDPIFEDGIFVQSWILIDFPFGPKGETVLDRFEAFLAEAEAIRPELQRFIDAARRSRLGLHQDAGRTRKAARFCELLSGRETTVVPSVEAYDNGEIWLTRIMEHDGQSFVFGDPKGFPASKKTHIQDMVLDKMFYVADEEAPLIAQYETFMKLAGPYWMSCVTTNDEAPILPPDHYRTYLSER